MEYKSTYTQGTKLKNFANLAADGQTVTSVSTYESAISGGTAAGELANRIKLIKVDADDNTVTLPGATFDVIQPDGTVTSGILTQGTYTVREKVAPTGYQLDPTPYTMVVQSVQSKTALLKWIFQLKRDGLD